MAGALLFCFLVQGNLLTKLTKLLQLESRLGVLLIFTGSIIEVMAHSAFHINTMILGHS